MDATNRPITLCESKTGRAMEISSEEGSPRIIEDSGGTIKIVIPQERPARCLAAEPPDTTAPDRFILSVAVKDGAVHLVWSDDIPEDVTLIAPVRSDTGEPNTFENLMTGGLPVTARSYTDATVVAGETYYYRLRFRHGPVSSATYSVTRNAKADIAPDMTEPLDSTAPPDMTEVEPPDTTSEDSLIGEAGDPPPQLATHEPAGMTLIGSFDGSVKESDGMRSVFELSALRARTLG